MFLKGDRGTLKGEEEAEDEAEDDGREREEVGEMVW